MSDMRDKLGRPVQRAALSGPARLCAERAKQASGAPVDVHGAVRKLAQSMRAEAMHESQQRAERRMIATAAVIGSTSPLLTMPAHLEAEQRRKFIEGGKR